MRTGDAMWMRMLWAGALGAALTLFPGCERGAGAATAAAGVEGDCCAAPEEEASEDCCASSEDGTDAAAAETVSLEDLGGRAGLHVPDVELIDQDGRRVSFFRDLVQGRVVAMNFIFTTCTTICPPLTANFASLQALRPDLAERGVSLISVSVDPLNDTPQRLKAWGEKFHAGPGWTFLTGDKRTVDDLLKALHVFTPLKEDHSPFVLVGNEAAGSWKRINGLAAPAVLSSALDDMLALGGPDPDAEVTDVADVAVAEEPVVAEEAPVNEEAQAYFTDTVLVNHKGEPMRFYSDLIRGKIVVMESFFTSCTGVCPVMAKNFVAVQEALGDRLGKDVIMLSISVDPVTDTVDRLKEFGETYGAREGWYFLGGRKPDVDAVLGKLGFAVETREQHSNVVLIGNDRTGLWKKAFGLAAPDELVKIVMSVVDDAGQ